MIKYKYIYINKYLYVFIQDRAVQMIGTRRKRTISTMQTTTQTIIISFCAQLSRLFLKLLPLTGTYEITNIKLSTQKDVCTIQNHFNVNTLTYVKTST